MSASKMSRYVREFEDNPFWRKVMRPAMEAAIMESMSRLVYCENMRDIRRIQAGIEMTKAWLDFSATKIAEDESEAEFEKSLREADGDDK